MIRVEGLRKKMPGFELRADFKAEAGERLMISGPSGCGKTTLFRWICGVNSSAEAGRLWSEEKELTGVSVHQRNLGVVFQEQALFSEMNILENAGFGLRMRGVPAAERQKIVLPWLEKIGMAGRAQESVGFLSGGEKQRVALVRALVWKPCALLLDEPFSALDSVFREQLRKDLLEFHRQWPVPMILISHDREDARALATRELVCQFEEEGRVRKF